MNMRETIKRVINEEQSKKDMFFSVLRKVIPDNSTFKMSYKLPYSDEGEVHVIMKYSVLPESRIIKMQREDGSLWDGLHLEVKIDKLIWKHDYESEWTNVPKPHNLPTRFFQYFDDEVSDSIRRKLCIEYVEVYYKDPEITWL